MILNKKLIMRIVCYAFITLTALLFSQSTLAGNITVKITGAPNDRGTIGCALFSNANGFPTDGSQAIQQSHTPRDGSVTCVFNDVAAGSYAIASAHDANDNGKTDTNFLGIPKEVWGVSNNTRPRLRAPTFEEAMFTIEHTEDLNITINLDR